LWTGLSKYYIQIEKEKKMNEESIQDLWNIIKRSSICIISIPKK
jgi:hypothetical protein